ETENALNHGGLYPSLSFETIKEKVAVFADGLPENRLKLSEDQQNRLLYAAHIAPSAGNNQPWKWYVRDSVFYLFHDKSRSLSWGDFNEIGAYEGLGTAIENVFLEAHKLDLDTNIQLFPVEADTTFIAVLS